MYFDRFAETADAAYFNIEYPASANLNRKIGITRTENRFVQTNRRAKRMIPLAAY